jgi:hypothetical protein
VAVDGWILESCRVAVDGWILESCRVERLKTSAGILAGHRVAASCQQKEVKRNTGGDWRFLIRKVEREGKRRAIRNESKALGRSPFQDFQVEKPRS